GYPHRAASRSSRLRADGEVSGGQPLQTGFEVEKRQFQDARPFKPEHGCTATPDLSSGNNGTEQHARVIDQRWQPSRLVRCPTTRFTINRKTRCGFARGSNG